MVQGQMCTQLRDDLQAAQCGVGREESSVGLMVLHEVRAWEHLRGVVWLGSTGEHRSGGGEHSEGQLEPLSPCEALGCR